MVWDPDDCPDDWTDNDEREQEHRYTSVKRRSIMRTPEQRMSKTWNGNPVSGMESDHIMNSILFCERKFADALSFHLQCFPDAQRSDFYFKTVYEMFPEYVNLRNEWDQRMEKVQ